MKRRIIIWLLLTSILIIIKTTTSQQKDIKKRLADCASIKDDLKRLECYGRLARELGLIKISKQITIKDSSKWIIDITVFDTRGLSGVIKPLQETCGWK